MVNTDMQSNELLTEFIKALDEEIEAIKAGALYPYCKDVKLYKCPTGVRGEMRTYSIFGAMNGVTDGGGTLLKNRTQIRRSDERRLAPKHLSASLGKVVRNLMSRIK